MTLENAMNETNEDEYIAIDKKIEFWPKDISSFERYKRKAYEFVDIVPFDEDTPGKIFCKVNLDTGHLFDSPCLEVYYKNSREVSAFNKGMDAIVEAEFSIPNSENSRIIGIPVRQAKGKWLKNIILKYFH